MDALLAQELPGFAAQCLAAAQLAQRVNGYPVSADMFATFAEVANEGDPVKMFVAECCVLTTQTGQPHTVMINELYTAYQGWCIASGHRFPMARINFSRQVQEFGDWAIKKKSVMKGTQLLGVGLRASEVLESMVDMEVYGGFAEKLHSLTSHQEAVNQAFMEDMEDMEVFSNSLQKQERENIPTPDSPQMASPGDPANVPVQENIEKLAKTSISSISDPTPPPDSALESDKTDYGGFAEKLHKSTINQAKSTIEAKRAAEHTMASTAEAVPKLTRSEQIEKEQQAIKAQAEALLAQGKIQAALDAAYTYTGPKRQELLDKIWAAEDAQLVASLVA
jgi:hypothetical protein